MKLGDEFVLIKRCINSEGQIIDCSVLVTTREVPFENFTWFRRVRNGTLFMEEGPDYLCDGPIYRATKCKDMLGHERSVFDGYEYLVVSTIEEGKIRHYWSIDGRTVEDITEKR